MPEIITITSMSDKFGSQFVRRHLDDDGTGIDHSAAKSIIRGAKAKVKSYLRPNYPDLDLDNATVTHPDEIFEIVHEVAKALLVDRRPEIEQRDPAAMMANALEQLKRLAEGDTSIQGEDRDDDEVIMGKLQVRTIL